MSLELFALLLFGALLRSLLRMLSACACVPVALRSGGEMGLGAGATLQASPKPMRLI